MLVIAHGYGNFLEKTKRWTGKGAPKVKKKTGYGLEKRLQYLLENRLEKRVQQTLERQTGVLLQISLETILVGWFNKLLDT